MRQIRNRKTLSVVWATAALLSVLMVASSAMAEDDAPDLKVQWGANHETLSFRIDGQDVQFPHAMTGETFLTGDKPFEFSCKKTWPLVMCLGRWTVDTADWPAEQRENALDYVLMRLIDANSIAADNPEKIRSSKLTGAPQFAAGANSVVEALRGQTVDYEMTAIGGVGANDSVIQSQMMLGASKDGKTIFYHDTALSMSDNHLGRDFFLAVHDTGDELRFEIHGIYVCKPRGFFKDTAMDRTEGSVRYVVERMVGRFGAVPTEAEIEKRSALVDEGASFSDLVVVSAPSAPPAECQSCGGCPMSKWCIPIVAFLLGIVVGALLFKRRCKYQPPAGA